MRDPPASLIIPGEISHPFPEPGACAASPQAPSLFNEFPLPASNISHQWHPCPNCKTSTRIVVITAIESNEDLSQFTAHQLNRTQCFNCGAPVEVPVRVTVKPDCEGLPPNECFPLVLLENPEVLDDLLSNTPPLSGPGLFQQRTGTLHRGLSPAGVPPQEPDTGRGRGRH